MKAAYSAVTAPIRLHGVTVEKSNRFLVAVTLWTWILEVLCSKLCGDTDYPH
jgi:hypothetical protein